MPQSIESAIVSRIYSNGRGWAFSQIDFTHLGSRFGIDQALHRLAAKGTIRRVTRGIYDYPRHSELLQRPLGPDTDQVADAFARKFGWRIQPSGAAALNLLGLSTQVPAKLIYLSDGPDRNYSIGATTLSFEHTALKEVGFSLSESRLLVSALKALGQDGITADVIHHLRTWLPDRLRAKVLKDTRTATGWVYSAIREICMEAMHA